MYAKSQQSKSGRGSVQIKVSKGWLQLVFSYPMLTATGEIKGKRFYVSVGQRDTPFGRQRAAALAATIQRDIDYGEFDASLSRYKSAASVSSPSIVEPAPIALTPAVPQLGELWTQYEQFKKHR
jgi:integrase